MKHDPINTQEMDSIKQGSRQRILIMTAVTAEKEAVIRGLPDAGQFDVLEAGVGPVAAAVNTTKALSAATYDLVISAGIGGGFKRQAEVGSLVVAEKIIAADLGAETAEGFHSVDQLGFGSAHLQVNPVLVTQVVEAFQAAGLPVTSGPILTVSTVTGTAATAAQLAKRVPKATAEAMEGFGVAYAAACSAVPYLEIRAISNPVGPRDRAAWKIEEALDMLTAASSVLQEVLL